MEVVVWDVGTTAAAGIPKGPDRLVAEIVPVPVALIDAPVPTTIAAVLLVLLVIALNVDGPAGP